MATHDGLVWAVLTIAALDHAGAEVPAGEPITLTPEKLAHFEARGKVANVLGPAEDEASAAAGLDELRTAAEAVGIKVDRRWGEERLREEIEKVVEAAASETADRLFAGKD